ncbi:MAG: DUF2225 domain-containing protein [Pseudomonadota bacterium]
MNDSLYTKKADCPICGKQFSSTKAKVNSCKVDRKDEDFCVHYVSLNPLYYEIFVCPHCGYAAAENSFRDITDKEIKLLKDAFSGRTVAKSFCEERTLEDAIAAFKLAIFTAELRSAKASTLAGLCLKLAWMYRFAGNNQEEVFLIHALNRYAEAYDKEGLPIGNLDEMSVQYLMGELSRRVGMLNDAVVWFGKVVSHPDRRENPRIENLAREQWTAAKEQIKSGVE